MGENCENRRGGVVMTISYEAVRFVKVEEDGFKTRFWSCYKRKRKVYIGNVAWNYGKRRYCFYPPTNFANFISANFGEKELEDIANLLKFVNKK